MLIWLKVELLFFFCSFVFREFCFGVFGRGICWKGLSQCISNILYINDLNVVFNEMLEGSRLIFASNFFVPFSTFAVFVLVEEFSWFTNLPTSSFSLFDCFSYLSFELLEWVEVTRERFFLKFAKSSISFMDCYFTVVKLGSVVLVWWKVFSIVLFAIVIKVSVKCFIKTVQFGSWTSFVLHKFLNFCQSALFAFQQGGLLFSLIGCVISRIMGKWSLPQGLLWTFHI